MNKLMVPTLIAATALAASAADVSTRVKADFADYGSRAFVHYAVPPMSEVQRLPDTYPSDGTANAPVKIFAAKGEYETGSFNVWGVRDLGKVRFELGEFKKVANEKGERIGGGGEKKGEKIGGGGVIFPKANLDLKVVKCWYQNLNAWFSYFGDAGDYKLVPELLLNDEDLIRTDAKTKSNYAKIVCPDGKTREKWINPPVKMNNFQPMAAGFDDAATLQPVAIPKNEFRNFFLTVRVTRDIPAGVYRGEIVLKKGQETRDRRQEAQSQLLGTIPVEIHVADYELPHPKCYREPTRDFLVSFYHYNSIGHVTGWNGGDRELAVKQLDNMIADMVAHGQNVHPCWYNMQYEELYTADLCVRKGMRPDVFFGGALPYPKTREARMAQNVREVNEYDRRFGCHNIYHGWGDEPGLGPDGAGGWFNELDDLIEEWHSLGMKHFIAGEECIFRKSGYCIDWFNIAREPAVSNYQLELWNAVPGKRAAWYARQHVGAENPALARRQNGLMPWLSGYTAFMNYAHHLGPYNDETGYYKPMVFAYGAHHGMIDTIQWEGFREGIDDIRYATLLCELARKAMASKDAREQFLGTKAFQYLALVNHKTDALDTCRAEMRRQIDALLKVARQDPVPPLKRLAPKPAASDAVLAQARAKFDAACAAAKKPADRDGAVNALAKVYRDLYRIEELVDFYEKEGRFMDAAKTADECFQFDRAHELRMKIVRDPKRTRYERPAAAWGVIFRHPELWDDKEVVEQLSVIVDGHADWYARPINDYGILEGGALRAPRFRTGWKNAYRLITKVADAHGYHAVGAGTTAFGIQVFAEDRDYKAVNEIIARRLAVKGVNAAERYRLGLFAKLFGADVRKGAVADIVRAYEKEHLTKDIKTDARMGAINAAGSIANALCNNDMVRELEAYRVAQYKFEERRRYTVKFSAKPIEGTDWTGVDAAVALCDRKFGGSTELLYTDVTSGNRNVAKVDAKAEPMRLQVAADAWGIHFRYESTDTNALKVAAHRATEGGYESYLSYGKNKPYVCLLKDDCETKWRAWNTVYDAIGQRQVDPEDTGRFRSYSKFTENRIINVVSISWDCYADDLPRDGSVWDYEVFRWGTDGCAWNGSRSIHQRSTWGELVFALSKSDRAKIVRRVADNAFWKFRREYEKTMGIDRYEGAVRHWRDRNVGDPAFYEARVKTWAAKLREAGKLLGEDPSDETILRLEANGTIAAWHNVFQILDRMRQDWLERRR